MARAMRSGREQGTRIPRATLRFVAAGVVAMVVVAVVGSSLSVHLGEQEAIRQVQRLAEVLGHEVIEPSLADGVETAESRLRLDRVVRESVLPAGVVRVKLWDSSGRIVYSDEPRLIGASYPLGEHEKVVIATGEPQAEVTDLSEPENAYEKEAGKLLEVYVPVKTLDGRSMLFEMYMPYHWVSASSRRVWLAFVPLFLGALAALQLVQAPLARSMARRLQEGQRDRERLLRRAAEASDMERRRIAADIHDGVVQDLTGVSYLLAATAEEGDLPDRAQDALRQGAAETRRSVRLLRTLVFDIYPPNLHTEGLESALADLVAGCSERGLSTNLQVSDGVAIDEDLERLVYRTAQEAVRNAFRHASPRRLDVSLGRDDGSVTLTVEDDGRGFVVDEQGNSTDEVHVGLRLLSDLAADAGGALEVESVVGAGTRVRLTVPVG